MKLQVSKEKIEQLANTKVAKALAALPKDRQDKILKLAALKMAADAHSKMAQLLKDREAKPVK
jgi:Mg/Co/Ni transporter MgtE